VDDYYNFIAFRNEIWRDSKECTLKKKKSGNTHFEYNFGKNKRKEGREGGRRREGRL
jgi:hypothetical protein